MGEGLHGKGLSDADEGFSSRWDCSGEDEMTEEDLAAIEGLLKNRLHIILPEEDWSRAMTNALFDKIPDLVAGVRELLKGSVRA